MIDVKNKKCNCGKAHQSFNFIGLKAEYCSQCKEDEMINVKYKKCYYCEA